MTRAVEPNLHERVLGGGVEGDVVIAGIQGGVDSCVMSSVYVEIGCCGSSQDGEDG